MKCYVCEDQELILLGDHVYDVVDEYSIVTNLSCPECEALVFVHQKAKEFKVAIQDIETIFWETKK